MEHTRQLLEGFDLTKFKVKKPAKNEERKRLVEKLSECTGRTKKSIHFSTLIFPESWLQDALNYCLHFTEIKTRNYKFGEFIKLTKEEV